MKWPLFVIAGMAVVLIAIASVSLLRAADLSWRSQLIYTSATGATGPTQKQQDQANRLSQQAQALQQVVTPLSTGSLACGMGILLVLGRRWQLRLEPSASPEVAGQEPPR